MMTVEGRGPGKGVCVYVFGGGVWKRRGVEVTSFALKIIIKKPPTKRKPPPPLTK